MLGVAREEPALVQRHWVVLGGIEEVPAILTFTSPDFNPVVVALCWDVPFGRSNHSCRDSNRPESVHDEDRGARA
eukprot:CAMPEP_0197631722 /NCGR_PEP_ID=MMETSP1338-20131121/8792_1 /TAXON_ID=43686 ORGANISM="Pelagodinium beii, Strain RCC1491" /NCGR_SAMPLE_ID=MMETSP1338 /ASSEMBLY_ACC=CAM_ASM_000754 /LENGTH=74 /DNA_ID=CAMNT_0043203243 /DNA_START=245 /DNA_END=469 /DNA_ORIENTATION=-